jgi:hypothetical protein
MFYKNSQENVKCAKKWYDLKRSFLFLLLILAQNLVAHEVDFIIFSYNRPMQLYALLESCEKWLDGLGKTTVIVRADGAEYEEAYKEVFERFYWAEVCYQGKKPKEDFKPMLLWVLEQSASPYLMFAVDDMIVKDHINLSECVDIMLKTHAWGFYLRMGTNITYSYNQNIPLQVPNGRSIDGDYFKWRFKEGKSYWCSFNTVDMTIYRRAEIEPFMRSACYVNPNTFEDRWWRIGSLRKHGVSFQESKVLNIPLNLVNNDPARHLNAYSPAELLQKFQQGYKIDICGYEKIRNNSAHFDLLPTFIPKTQ